MTYVGIVGSRNFRSCWKLIRFIERLPEGIVVVSGAGGLVDRTAARLARHRGHTVIEHRPQGPGTFGQQCARRNQLIVDQVDYLVAFWDGVSPGTRMTIGFASRKGIKVVVVGE